MAMIFLTSASGEEDNTEMPSVRQRQKNFHAVALGRKGGRARAKSLTKKQLTDIGRKGAKARWGKKRKRRRPGG